MPYKLSLVDLSKVVETEEHIPERVLWLYDKIISEGSWCVPIILDSNSYAIMDGHHRYNVALKLGIKRIPVFFMSYDDFNVRVESWREDVFINKEVVKDYIIRGEKFPYKTTKHIFSPIPEEVDIPISLLY